MSTGIGDLHLSGIFSPGIVVHSVATRVSVITSGVVAISGTGQISVSVSVDQSVSILFLRVILIKEGEAVVGQAEVLRISHVVAQTHLPLLWR